MTVFCIQYNATNSDDTYSITHSNVIRYYFQNDTIDLYIYLYICLLERIFGNKERNGGGDANSRLHNRPHRRPPPPPPLITWTQSPFGSAVTSPGSEVRGRERGRGPDKREEKGKSGRMMDRERKGVKRRRRKERARREQSKILMK